MTSATASDDEHQHDVLAEQRADARGVRREVRHRSISGRSSARRRVSASTPTSSRTKSSAGCSSSSAGGAGLHDVPGVHHDDAVGQPQRFVDVVRDEHDRRAELAVDARDLVLQRRAHDRVDRGERLVHQQHARLRGERARDADALRLAAGELARLAVAVARGLEPDQPQQLVDARGGARVVPAEQRGTTPTFCATV